MIFFDERYEDWKRRHEEDRARFENEVDYLDLSEEEQRWANVIP